MDITAYFFLAELGTANWFVRCEATQLAVAATSHSVPSSEEMRSVEMR